MTVAKFEFFMYKHESRSQKLNEISRMTSFMRGDISMSIGPVKRARAS